MASNPEFVQYIADQLAPAGQVTYHKMFGDYGVYLDGKMFALVCDDQLFIKITKEGAALAPQLPKAPPYDGAKDYFLMMLVVLPQAFAVSVPPLVANIIFLIKEISVVSAIALPDLMYVTKDLIGNSYKTDESLILLVSAYVVLLLPISLLGYWLEKKVRYAGFGN